MLVPSNQLPMIFAQAPPTEHPPPLGQLACLGIIIFLVFVLGVCVMWLIGKLAN